MAQFDFIESSRFDNIIDESSLTEKRKRLSVGNQDRILFNGEEVPYAELPTVFRKFSDYKILEKRNGPIPYVTYILYIDNKKFTYRKFESGDYDFYVDDKVHCANVPAVKRIIEDRDEFYYYSHGTLNRLDGPAIIRETGDVFCLNGETLNIYQFIERNPLCRSEIGTRGDANYTIHRAGDYAVVEGLDGTRILLQKDSSAQPSLNDLILELVAHRIPGYKVVGYGRFGHMAQPVYNYLSSDSGNWKIKISARKIRVTYSADDGTYVILSYFKRSNKLYLDTNAFNGELFRTYTDFSFDQDSGLARFPKIRILRDSNGHRHCEYGPAVVTPSDESLYYLHGHKVTEEMLDNAQFSVTGKFFYWLDEQGFYHSPVAGYPAKIYDNGDAEHWCHGKRHNAFGAADITNNNKSYYIFGTKISADEFKSYRPAENAVIFSDDAGYLHRTGGPAVIDFDVSGKNTRYWYQHGALHNEEGPAILGSDGGFSYYLHGELHRDGGPAVWIPEDNKFSYFERGVEINEKAGKNMSTAVNQSNPQQKFEEALNRIKSRKATVSNTGGLEMSTKTVQHGSAPADSDDSRVKQVTSGAKLGLQKAALRVGSEKAAEKIVDLASPSDSKVVTRIVQMALLLGSAELMERLPEGATAKVGLTQERREAFGGLSRFVAGETLGRDAVDLVSFIGPMLLEKLQGVSTEEIAELTNDAQEVEQLEAISALAKK